MLNPLSSVQAEVLNFYKDFIKKNDRIPSLGEVASGLDREKSNIHYHVKNLEKAGVLVRTGGHRGIQLVEKRSKVIPFLGLVACGRPITILEEANEFVHVPEDMIRDGSAHYALKATGDSMIKAKIQDGDMLVIRQQSDANDGDIAVVATGETPFEVATLKRVYHKKNALLLRPENDALESYIIRQGEIRGKLVGVIRNFE